jgi:uracil-DNA glycosylase
VTRCYPGSAPSGRGDRTPSPPEQELCAFWREWEFHLIAPKLIVPVGGLATRRLLGLKSVTEAVGRRFELDGAVAIPLAHPSGASGWLNDPANRKRVTVAAQLISDELENIGDADTRR